MPFAPHSCSASATHSPHLARCLLSLCGVTPRSPQPIPPPACCLCRLSTHHPAVVGLVLPPIVPFLLSFAPSFASCQSRLRIFLPPPALPVRSALHFLSRRRRTTLLLSHSYMWPLHGRISSRARTHPRTQRSPWTAFPQRAVATKEGKTTNVNSERYVVCWSGMGRRSTDWQTRVEFFPNEGPAQQSRAGVFLRV